VGNKLRACLLDAMSQWELEVGDEELLNIWAADILGLLDLLDTDDVNRPEASAVPGSHILVQALDSINAREFTELLVHVVCSRAGVVAKPDTKVLDLQGLLFVDNVDADNFTAGLLDLFKLPKEVPETGLCNDFVGSEDTHAVDFRSGLSLRREMASDDLEFL